MEKILNKLMEMGISFGGRLLVAVVVFFAGRYAIKAIKKWIVNTPRLSRLDDGVRSFTVSFANIFLNIILIITVAMVLGIPTTSFITALASCGVAIGLALQGSLSNFAGGIMILIFKPFKVGDFITAMGVSGSVKSISVVYTVLTTADNKTITIPNGNLMNSVVENCSVEETRRVDLVFGVSSSADVDKVKAILLEAMTTHPMVLDDPEPFARLTLSNETGMQFILRAWCKSSDYGDVMLDLTERVKREFNINSIGAPSSKIDVNINNH